MSGGSQTAASVTPAVQAAAKQAQLKLLTAAARDAGLPTAWRSNPINSTSRTAESSAKENRRAVKPFTAFLARNGLPSCS